MTGNRAARDFWGWHSSPEPKLDRATRGRVLMDGDAWFYGPWGALEPRCGSDRNTAFDLLTHPEDVNQVPGDCNQDGMVNLTDAICLLDLLFRFPKPCPCADGSIKDPANVALKDWNGDGDVNLTDVIGLLGNCFGSGPPHVLAVPGNEKHGCILIPNCPDVCPP
jgi:hypothetical protein